MKENLSLCVMHECSGAHMHSYPQILSPLRSRMPIRVGDEEFQISPRELILIPQGMEHQCDFTGDLLVINLNPDDASREHRIYGDPVTVPLQGQIMHLVSLIQEELRTAPDSTAVEYLYRYLFVKVAETCALPSIRYINEHYDLPVTVESLARLEGYNVNYYTDWFKSRTGMSPALYLRRVRIRRAKELLSRTAYSLSEIAAMVGYGSNAAFTRAFRSVTGSTPTSYRNCPCFREGKRAEAAGA